MKRIYSLFALLSCMLIVGGCDLAKPVNQDIGQELGNQNQVAQPAAQIDEPAQAEDNTVTVSASTELRTRTNVGATPQNNPARIVTVPVRTLFSVRDRLVLSQIDHAMQMFRGEHGRLPANHAEFMDRIIRPNNINLPPLRPGESYIYENGELKIQRPE